jgi:hypothetical protein
MSGPALMKADQVGQFLAERANGDHFALQKSYKQNFRRADRRGRSPVAGLASPHERQPKIGQAKRAEKFCGRPLKLISAFLIRFLPLLAVPGASSWVRQTELGAGQVSVLHGCLALLRIHLALRRTWL